MKKWIVWTISCSMCISIIFHTYSFVQYTGNSGICYKKNEYVCWEERQIKENPNYKNLTIFIDLNTKTLEIIGLDDRKILKNYTIASGKKDTPSPIGSFKIIGKGSWGEGFGTRFMALNVPWGKYGIHGTNKPNSIGGSASHGCIRMNNKDREDVYRFVKVGTPVIIWGGPYGAFGNGFRVIEPGFTGADVYEVQRYMKKKGYYPGWVDGIYGEGMKIYMLKFRKDYNLKNNHNIDWEFYKALGVELFE